MTKSQIAAIRRINAEAHLRKQAEAGCCIISEPSTQQIDSNTTTATIDQTIELTNSSNSFSILNSPKDLSGTQMDC